MLRASLSAAALILSISIPAASACAQDGGDQRARLHFESGASYYDAGEYDTALREFQRAYELSQRPQLFYNLSLCYQMLGDIAEAANYLERYLAEVPQAENRANLEIRLRHFRERLAAGATAATHTETATQAETATAMSTEAALGTDATATTETTATTATVETTTTTTATAPPPSDAGPNAGAIAGFSVAAVGVVMAAVFGPLTIVEDGSLSSGCGQLRACTDAQLSNLRTYALVTDIGLGVALAGAVVGAIFLFTAGGSSSGEQQSALRITPLAGPGSGGVVVGGSF